jgi:hypothetical protein
MVEGFGDNDEYRHLRYSLPTSIPIMYLPLFLAITACHGVIGYPGNVDFVSIASIFNKRLSVS